MGYDLKYKGAKIDELLDKAGTALQEHQDISGKLDKTEAATTYLAKKDAATVATSGSYNDLSNKPTIPAAVTETTVANWGFTKNTGTYSKPSGGIPKTDLAPAVQTSLGKADTALQSYTEKYTGTYSKPSTGIPKSDLASAVQTSLGKADSALQSYTETDPVFKASAAAGITSSDITNWNSKTSNTGTITGIKMNGASKGTSGVVDLGTVITAHQDISGKADKSSLATVATSGSYTDLSNKPTIPSAVTETTVSGWGFTKNSGTITKVQANGTDVASSGTANIPAASTSKYGVTKLSSATNSTSTSLAATASAVKAAYDLAASKTANIGTITEIKMNGASKGTSGSVDLGNVVIGDGTITKIVYVSALPSNPDSKTLYLIP